MRRSGTPKTLGCFRVLPKVEKGTEEFFHGQVARGVVSCHRPEHCMRRDMTGSLRSVAFLLVAVATRMAAAAYPNVLLIITDEHNFRTLGCYRDLLSQDQGEMWGPGTIVRTPNLDRLAEQGVLCSRAYATAPVCSPCRAAMITGLYPHNAGVPTNNFPLRDDVPTLATLLNAQGYRTGFMGKWHLGGKGKPEWSPKIDGGFGFTTFMFNRGHWKKFLLTNAGPEVAARDAKGQPSYAVADATAETYATDFLTDRTIDFVTADSEQPFFAVVSYPDPHGPNTVRTPYDKMFGHLRFLPPRTYGRVNVPSPKWLGGEKNHAIFRGEQMAAYFGMVKCLDENIGRLLVALEETGKLDSTIIMMTSDHGDLCYEHDRLNKGNPYEGSARVPMLIRYPARLPKGSVYREPVGTVDVTPTLVGIADVKTDVVFQGRDLSRSLAEGVDAESKITFLRNSGTAANWICAVDARYKLVLSVDDRPWLFDAEQDPDELLNFFGRPGSELPARRLAEALQRYIVGMSDAFGKHPAIAASLETCL